MTLYEKSYEKFARYYDVIYQRYDYDQECDFLINMFQRYCEGKSERILDLGCGTGSHDFILSKKGFKVVGIDFSTTMIELAREKARSSGLNVEFFVQDMRELQLPKDFDCAICMFGGFGYVLSDEGLKSLFKGLRNVLKPNGLFLFEFWNKDGLKPTPYRSWDRSEADGIRVYRLSKSDYNADEGVLDIRFAFVVLEQDRLVDEFEELHRIRIYSLNEMKSILRDEGFNILHMLAGYAGKEEPIEDTFRVFAIAKLIEK
jgi:SAM-dependent methyltransferase